MKPVKRGAALIVLLGILLCAAGCGRPSSAEDSPVRYLPEVEVPGSNTPDVTEPEVTASEVVKAMGIGWNLGNTLDSIDPRMRDTAGKQPEKTREEFYETYWGNPVTTAEMIDAVAEAGFGAIRIPVTFSDHMDENYRIRPEWLSRVGQIVDYVLDNDIYCIINIHHDTGSGSWPWLRADPENIGRLEDQLRIVWLQIAGYFRDYDDRLLFESFNEILDTSDRWGGAGPGAYNAVNRLNQVFVDAVRSTGGGNGSRFLIVKTYAAGAAVDLLNAFALPEDSAEDRLIIGAHYYGVLPFTWRQSQVSWTDAYSDWDRSRDGKPVETVMARLSGVSAAKGAPVIICEFGAQNKENTGDRASYAGHYVETAKQYGITCFWWDDGGQFADVESIKSFTLLDRNNCRWFFPEVVDAMMAAAG